MTRPARSARERMSTTWRESTVGHPTELSRGASPSANLRMPVEQSGGAFITGSDFLMAGGVTASYFFGDLAG